MKAVVIEVTLESPVHAQGSRKVGEEGGMLDGEHTNKASSGESG
jgi:hypothetical protein